jgi:hypothetical protein
VAHSQRLFLATVAMCLRIKANNRIVGRRRDSYPHQASRDPRFRPAAGREATVTVKPEPYGAYPRKCLFITVGWIACRWYSGITSDSLRVARYLESEPKHERSCGSELGGEEGRVSNQNPGHGGDIDGLGCHTRRQIHGGELSNGGKSHSPKSTLNKSCAISGERW